MGVSLDWHIPDEPHARQVKSGSWPSTRRRPGRRLVLLVIAAALLAAGLGWLARQRAQVAAEVREIARLGLFQALVALERARLGLAPAPAVDTAAWQVVQNGDWQSLTNRYWLTGPDPAAETQARAFAVYVGRRFGPPGEARLLASLAQLPSAADFVRSRLRLEPGDFESDWWADVARRGSGSLEPAEAAPYYDDLLPGVFAAVCGDAIRLAGQDPGKLL